MTDLQNTGGSTQTSGAETGATQGAETTSSTAAPDATSTSQAEGGAVDTQTGAAADEGQPPADTRTPEQQAADAARAKVPGEGENYAFTAPEGVDKYVPAGAEDPAVKALMEGAKADGWSQGRLDDVFGALKILGDKGVFAPPFDAKAETAKLGANGDQLQTDSMTFLEGLKARNDITDEEFGELASLVPTAAGTRALNKLRTMMTETTTKIDPPTGSQTAPGGVGANGEKYTQAQVDVMKKHEDPRYRSDPRFKSAADKEWKEAFK